MRNRNRRLRLTERLVEASPGPPPGSPSRMVERFYAGVKRDTSAASANPHRSPISGCRQQAMEWGQVETNVARGIKRFAETKGRDRYLEAAEGAALLAALEEVENRAVVLCLKLLVFTGMCSGEAKGLRWENVVLREAAPAPSRHQER